MAIQGQFKGLILKVRDRFFNWAELFNSGNRPRGEVRNFDYYYLLTVELPGVQPGDVYAEVVDGGIEVFGKRKVIQNQQEAGSSTDSSAKVVDTGFTARFELPKNVDSDQVEGIYNNGWLRIFIPKLTSPSIKPVKIINEWDERKIKDLYSAREKARREINEADVTHTQAS